MRQIVLLKTIHYNTSYQSVICLGLLPETALMWISCDMFDYHKRTYIIPVKYSFISTTGEFWIVDELQSKTINFLISTSVPHHVLVSQIF